MSKSIQSNTFTLLMVLSILTIMMIIVSVLTPKVDVSMEEAFLACPGANDNFSRKKFVKKDNCYNVTSRDCLDVITDLHGSLEHTGINEDQLRKAVGVMENNIYTNKNSPDNTENYSLSQCVIPKHTANLLNMNNCKLGDLQLQNGNPSDVDVNWKSNDGCVITEGQLKGDLVRIVTGINDIYLGPKKEAQAKLEGGIGSNKHIARVNWDEYNTNTEESKRQDDIKEQIKRDLSYKEMQINHRKATESEHNLVASNNDKNIKRTRGLTQFLQNKVYGLRYKVFRGYWGYKGETLDFFAKYNPYEMGFIRTVNNFVGMRGLTTMTEMVSVDIRGIFRPTVSGDWQFALNSDDAAYMWIDDISVDFNAMTLQNSKLQRPGFRGMSPGNGNIIKINLNGTDDTPGYKIRIVQGNNGGPGGLQVKVMRPNSTNWEIFGEDNYLFSALEKGLLCRVYDLYFWDNLDGLLKYRQPMTVVPLLEIYHMYKEWWNASWGFVGSTKRTDFKHIEYTKWDGNKNDFVNKQTHPYSVHFYKWDNPGPTNETRSMNISGFFIPPFSGLYTFYLASDDSSYVWIGDEALEKNYNTKNAFFRMPGLHGTWIDRRNYFVNDQQVKTLIPVRIVQGDYGGANTLAFGYRRPGEANVSFDMTTDFKF